jgi:hypothetical protein
MHGAPERVRRDDAPGCCASCKPSRACRSASTDNQSMQRVAVGAVDDAREHEADRLAARLLHEPPGAVRMPHGMASPVPTLSRKTHDNAAGHARTPVAMAAGMTSGRPLDPATRSYFEPRMGRDLSQVRLHTGAASERLAHDLQARAFTLGNDIVFGKGQYQPDSGAGRELLAHELVHVAQSDGTTIRRAPTAEAASGEAPQPTELKLEGTLDQRVDGFKQLVKTTAVHRLIANQKNLGLWSLMVHQAIPTEDLAALSLNQSGGSRPYFELQDIEDPQVRQLRAEQALGKYRACTGCHIEKDLHGTRAQRESESLTAWASPNDIRAQQGQLSHGSSAPTKFGDFSNFKFEKSIPSRYQPTPGTAEAKLNAMFPDPEATRTALRRVEPIMQALGPSGYKVLPASMLETMMTSTPDALRCAIVAAIEQRQKDFGELIQKIQNGDVGWEFFAPIISSLLPSADPEVRAAIQKEMDDKAFWDRVEQVVVGTLTALALILTIFPPTTAAGLAFLGALEISLGIYGVQKGQEMIELGTAYGLATGADDVFTRQQQESADGMVFGGFVSMAGGWLQAFGGTARMSMLASKLAPAGNVAALTGTSQGVARVIQRGEFVITIGTDGSWYVTIASRPELVIMVRGNTATMYQMLPNGGMRAMQSATLSGEVATPATAPLLLSAGDDALGASTALTRPQSTALVPTQPNQLATTTSPLSFEAPPNLGPRVLITPPPKEQKLLGPGAPTTYSWDDISQMQQPRLWQEREIYVQQLYGSPGQQHFPVPNTGGRFVDAPVQLPSGQLFAGEVKSYRFGWITIEGKAQTNVVNLSTKIEQQIAKDVYLRNNVPGYDPRWIFTDAPPSEALRQALRDANITFIEHLR